MADGSPENRAGPKLMNDLTFSAPDKGLGDTKKCCGETFDSDSVKLSFYKELGASVSCEKSDTRGVAANRAAVVSVNSLNSSDADTVNGEDRKKRCIDRYDSSESSDSGVAVQSPTESAGSSGSDITEPRSPRSPESSCSAGEESASARMPPWVSDPAPPPAPRRLAPQPAPVRRRSQPPIHRRITEYFNHKMKPQNGVKRDQCSSNDDTKKKCLPKNGVTHDLEKYISYLSQTLSPKVLMDFGKHNDHAASKPAAPVANGAPELMKSLDLSKRSNNQMKGPADFGRPKDVKEKNHTNMNGFLEIRKVDTFTKEKHVGGSLTGQPDGKRQKLDIKSSDPSATGIIANSHPKQLAKRKMPIPANITASSDLVGMRIASTSIISQSPKKFMKTEIPKVNNNIVSSTTKLDSRMNGVTCGSNNLNLNPITKSTSTKKEIMKKPTQPAKRTNRKSSACIANSKNMTWSKVNNLKQVQLQQKQNCTNPLPNSTNKASSGEVNSAPKFNVPHGMNGIRQMPMTVNGSLGNINVPVTNFQNCQLNIPQPCNGAVNTNNLASYLAVSQNVMLTTLRIPQNSISTQTLGQQNNMSAFNRQNVNVSSPTKLNGQLVFPLMQNINGTVVQIPNLMAKMPNFVLPQTPQLTTQRQDHLPNQQATSFLINGGTLLKLANTVASPYSNLNKTSPVTSQSIPTMNKNATGMQAVGMTVPSKSNYTVNFSHPVLMPQPGFIVTSVPNINVKETWSYTNTNNASSSSQTTCSNPIVHHPPPIVANYTTQALHTSSIPIAPVKPPDNPIQGTEPPSSTVKEVVTEPLLPKCDIPWLSKTINNNIVTLEAYKKARPFAEVSNISKNIEEYVAEKIRVEKMEEQKEQLRLGARMETNEALRKVEEVARREETIFTQITVLKDVSSDVHNTVIEANFCSATTESESGIGTDKSIDSPSDSQTSKELDEDSSLSLSVSVSSVEVQSQKSPILKQPKTLRFPPKSSTKNDSDRRTTSTDTTSAVSVCLWENCKREFDDDPDLLEHLQNVHVETQAGKENYVCLWEQCKVRGKPSCSRLWLERHTLSHGGNKPFRCIVDGCERRFSSQTLLERHVNHHFNEGSSSAGSKKTVDSAAKLIRRNGKKLRYRRQPWSARMFDYFDVGTMEGLAYRLSRGTRWRLNGACPLRDAATHALTLRASLAATRCRDGRREALLTYHPPHVIEDEWVPEKEVKRTKRVEIASLPAHVKVALYAQFCASYREEEDKPVVSGAQKRKMGRRYGGNSFWPCGR